MVYLFSYASKLQSPWNSIIFDEIIMMDYQKQISKEKKQFLEELESINWFDYSRVSRKVVEDRLSKIENPIEYPLSLYDITFDAEGFEDKFMYQSLLTEIFESLKLPLKPDCQGDFENILITILGKKSYQYAFEIQDDWIDEGIIDEFLNSNIFPNENIENRLLPLPSFDQWVQFVFIPEKIYDEAVNREVIPQI